MKEDKNMSNTHTEIKMFGISIKDMMDAIPERTRASNGEMIDLAMSMLSDAQELMEMGNAHGANKVINRAKFLLSQTSRKVG